MNKLLPIFLYLLALGMLVPGLMLPILTIKANVDKQQMLQLTTKSLLAASDSTFVQNMIQSLVNQFDIEGTIEIFEKTRSILVIVMDLVDSGHSLVAMLIGLFAVIIPALKIMMVIVALLLKNTSVQQHLLTLNGAMSKWSMSDVFVMALLVSFMAVNANEQAIQAVQMQAQLEAGFYYFSAYCLLAIAAGQAIQKSFKFDPNTTPMQVEVIRKKSS